jgi:hypothetical protein
MLREIAETDNNLMGVYVSAILNNFLFHVKAYMWQQ